MSYDEHDWEQERYLESLGLGGEYWDDQYLRSLEYEMEHTVIIPRAKVTREVCR